MAGFFQIPANGMMPGAQGGATQPITPLQTVVRLLGDAIRTEPEPADQQLLQQALEAVTAVLAKNKREGK